MTSPNSLPPLNFRDVGGLPTLTGPLTRPNVLFRSDTLYRTDDMGPLAAVWPPSAVVDLRRADERTDFDIGWPDTTAVHHLSLLDPTKTITGENLSELYLDLLTGGAPAIAGVVGIAANTDGPLLVHCAAGKDRTGIVLAVLLRAAGVTREAVVADYLATGSRARRRNDRTAVFGIEPRHFALPDEFFDVSEDAINAVLDTVESPDDHAVSDWLIEHGTDAADIAAWRQRLVGDVP